MRRAFTLVEVLVVVGILAELAGLLVPVFKHAKRSRSRTGPIGFTSSTPR